jgi:hydroxymethylbilane synthase
LKTDTLILGTRGSELALRQTDMVMAALRAAHPALHVERKIIATTGDKRQDLRFSEFTEGGRLDKGIFTKELELALDAGEIDAAVHSLKDVPTEIPAQFCIAAVLPRAPVEDVLVSRDGWTVQTLPKNAKVGTSSVRRIRQLTWLRHDVTCVEIRGNVPTRLRKLFQPSELDAVLLARAGVDRLGLLSGDKITVDGKTLHAAILPCDEFLPAAGQGAIGIEARRDDAKALELLDAINHAETFARVSTERHFLHLLRAGCQTPIGAYTEIKGDTLRMKVRVFDESNLRGEPQESEASGPASAPTHVAAELAKRIQSS